MHHTSFTCRINKFMSKKYSQLRNFIKESIFVFESTDTINSDCEKLNPFKGYYDIDESNPPPVSEIINAWQKCNLKARENDVYHAIYSADDLWKYREYSWSAATASHEDVVGLDKVSYQDKWRFIPDAEGNVGLDKWNKMFEKMKSRGWDKNQPAYFEIGKNGAKIGEGNHRLAIAKQLGLSVPVFFAFKPSVSLSHASNV